ncbi:hypothetical protein MMC16_000107 [Acarospora aff. strigata]|nr:hypothetical protein [Acarospora aff. strigata]
MVDEKPNKYERADFLPIPTYEEATSSRPSSSHLNTGPQEISNDAERQGLLRQGTAGGAARRNTRSDGYQAPAVESARASLEFLSASGDQSPRPSDEDLRREITELTLGDPEDADGPSQRGHSLSKRITSITNTLSSINLPFRRWAALFTSIRDHMPRLSFSRTGSWVVVGRIMGGFVLMSVVYVLLASNIFTMSQNGGLGQSYNPEQVRIFVQNTVNGTIIQSYLEHLTAYDHIAGTEGNYVLARWVERLFEAAQVEDVGLERFDVYLNYPKAGGRRVAIIDPPEVTWEATIEEKVAYEDPPRQQTLVFHGYSRAGNVTGPLIYANYGSREDFQRLKDRGIKTEGAIALVRYYGTQGDRALKVKAAELAGAVGCIIYSDPADDGFAAGEPWPDGRFMPADGVQRGTVGLTSWIVGDVLSPGFASMPGEHKRISKDNNPGLNNIPSIPIAWRDAQRLLQAIKGHGEKVSKEWVGAVPEVEWWTGNQTSPVVQLMNEQDEVERQPIYNVIGKISGLERGDKSIIVGNHRDAWCFGAADPSSGTAVMLEVVRIFGELRQRGWRPLRTIEFASWDAEEYNLIGSTEHVEARIDDLRRNGYAYLNVDVAVTGTDFEAAGCPVFEPALLRVLGRVTDPIKDRTLRSIWEEGASKLGGLGAGSDYVAFQDMAGVSSLDFGFQGPAYPYHSCYDNFEWMTKFGDPGFRYHTLMAQIWALLILEMADTPVLPFDMEAYAKAVKGYVDDLEKYVMTKDTPSPLDLSSLHDAADTFITNAAEFHTWDRTWSEAVNDADGLEGTVTAIKRMSHNTRMANFDTHLLDLSVDGGLPNRTQYKHILYAPQTWAAYDAAYFPGVRDAVDEGDWDRASVQVKKAAGILDRAARKLNN